MSPRRPLRRLACPDPPSFPPEEKGERERERERERASDRSIDRERDTNYPTFKAAFEGAGLMFEDMPDETPPPKKKDA